MNETFASAIRENGKYDGKNVWFYRIVDGGCQRFPNGGKHSPTAYELGVFQQYPLEYFVVNAVLYLPFFGNYKIINIEIDWKKHGLEIDVDLADVDLVGVNS